MTLVIVILLIAGYLLIATGHLTGVNKAAIAMFMCTAGWVVYVCWGTDFVMRLHAEDYVDYLNGDLGNSHAVKHFIYHHVFLHYVGYAAAVVIYLLATMTIVEILTNNGCFHFITVLLRTRSARKMMWIISSITFFISANLDNLTTALLMLLIMRQVVQGRRLRLLMGASIVLAAHAGGCCTVIGDPTGLLLWTGGAVTPTRFSAVLLPAALVSWGVSTWLISRLLPLYVDFSWQTTPFRGDDSRLSRWQQACMLLVGVGGLWFIPTFHRITLLSPFLGALCVLSVLWVMNEVFNREFLRSDRQLLHPMPQVLQYGAIQQLLFVLGIMLGMGVVAETGVLGDVGQWLAQTFGSVWAIGLLSAFLSAVVDTFTVAITNISLYEIASSGPMAANGMYWPLIAYCTSMGGTLLLVGSPCGLALMQSEHLRWGWYARTIMPRVVAGFVAGLGVLAIMSYYQ